MLRTILICCGVLLAGFALWFFLGRGESSAATGDFTLETAQVERGDVARLVSASGAVRALTTVEVGSQVSGQIVELLADFNSEVKEGDVIARIDPQTFESRVQSARADVTSAKANLDVQKAAIRRSEATLDQVQKNYARTKALYAQDAIALSTLEDLERQLSVSRADLEVSKAQLRTTEASLIQRRASLDSAMVDLNRTVIRSPIDGVVIERNVDAGQTVAASFSAPVLFRIAQDLGDIRIDAAVVEGDIGGINTGDPATFKVDAYPDEEFTGIVEQVRLASESIQNVVTYTVVIAAENRRAQLLPGMTANVEIIAEKREGVLRVSEQVLRFRPPSDGVTVLTSEGEPRGGGRGRGGQARGGRGGFGGADMLAGLDIEQSRKDAIQKEIGEKISEVRASMGDAGATFNRGRMRDRIMQTIDKVLRDNLSGEEYKQMTEARNARASVRRVSLYTPAPDDALKVETIAVGLSDGSNVEILRGADEGDTFVTRLRIAEAG